MTTKLHRKKIVRQLPPVGTILKGRLRGETYTAVVAESEGLPSARGIKLGDELYPSLSAAAKAVTGYPVNGWRFWSRWREPLVVVQPATVLR